MKNTSFATVVAACVAAVALQYSGYLSAQALNSPTFTAAQATMGKDAYAQNCASCHGNNVDDGEFAPPLKGVEFRQRWGGKSLDALFTDISTRMPTAAPGSLERRDQCDRCSPTCCSRTDSRPATRRCQSIRSACPRSCCRRLAAARAVD